MIYDFYTGGDPEDEFHNDLIDMILSVISWTGIVGKEGEAVARITLEYMKPHKGIWGNDT